ncbi:MAG: hypothetical protein LBH16_05900 [Treponema sp.]|jgi:hypothetical protein|nr:hypothetical protein [Treponema sp.]
MEMVNKFNRRAARSCAEVNAKFVKRAAYGAVFTLVLLIGAMLISCADPDPAENANLNGTWSDAYSSITINTSANTIVYENNYAGIIKNSPNYESVNGVLIVEFTSYMDADYSNYPDVTYTPNTENIGKFGALYWTGLTAASVSMADAYDGYIHAIFDTLAEAQTNFTMDNAGNYIDWSITSPYTK